MDCERFESTLIDELYDELDELTSAASKRHVAGCSRCANLLNGLRATRRLATMPLVDIPAGLEDRILSAAREAQKVVPLRGRVATAVSWAGSWAMRPQTAMAAVFLLMIGSSVLLLRSNNVSVPAGIPVAVTEHGSPAAAALPAEDLAVDPKVAATAHGALNPTSAPASPAVAAASAVANERARKSAAGDLASEKAEMGALARADDPLNAGPPGGAPYAPRAVAAPVPRAASKQAAALDEPYGGAGQAIPQGQAAGGDFASGMAAYRSKNYEDATRTFEALASGGDSNAALWAARSVRASSGCASAVGRFDNVANRYFGTVPGYDATLDAGDCYKQMGSFDLARQRYARLLTVPSHAARAKAALDSMASQSKSQPMRAPAQQSEPAARPPTKAIDTNQAY